EEALLGGLDIEASLKKGDKIFKRGLLAKANKGVLFIDDINLLPAHILSLIFEVQNRGEVIVEREGFSLKEPADFIVIATMCPTEGYLPSHILENFGMCAFFGTLKDQEKRLKLLKNHLSPLDVNSEEKLVRKISIAKEKLRKIQVPEEILSYIIQISIENNVSGHRGEFFLYYASKAYAAFLGCDTITTEHVDTVLPLVIRHRTKEKIKEKAKDELKKELSENKDSKTKEEKKEMGKGRKNTEIVEGHQSGEENSKESVKEESREKAQILTFESLPYERVFEVGPEEEIKFFNFKRDRKIRTTSGKRTTTLIKDKRGRYVKSVMRAIHKDIALDATLRASAPFQRLRKLKENGKDLAFIIKEEDIRYKLREKKMGHLVIFLVDSSGSMGVQRRMVETKAAIQALLRDCYQKRDKVSMIVFRKDKAEVILPPTSSVELASKKLKEIPTGGKTPLGAGLLETYKLIKFVSRKDPKRKFLVVLITDGKANQSLSGEDPYKEINKIISSLKAIQGVDYIVIDTEDKNNFIKINYTLEIAKQLEADYLYLEDLKARHLTKIVQRKTKEL
ncbi:MAG: VWA domain-containing protein, partial [Caldimicrobium sp.]